MPVNTLHPQYSAHTERWQRNRDANRGQDAVKRGDAKYLPTAFVDDTERYTTYKQRALWLGVTSRTRWALSGAVFRKDMEVELPTELVYIFENFDGAGGSIETVAKQIIDDLQVVGRYGLLIDYPDSQGAVTLAEQRRLNLRPFAAQYDAEAIINWREDVINGTKMLTLVVLKEMVNHDVDGFDYDLKEQYRVLRLVEGVYEQSVYDEGGSMIGDVRQPRQANGQVFNYIPFVFIGAEANTPTVDDAPLSELIDANYAHYQVSADHMENLHIHGQITLGIQTDMSLAEYTAANPGGIKVGARAGHFLGATGAFHTATAPESSSLSKGLEDLKLDMINIGARIVQSRSGNQTAQAARIDADSENSVLQTMVSNASEALTRAVQIMSAFITSSEPDVKVELNREFWETQPDAQVLTVMMGLSDRGVIALADERAYARRVGLIAPDRTDEEIDAEVEQNDGVDLDSIE